MLTWVAMQIHFVLYYKIKQMYLFPTFSFYVSTNVLIIPYMMMTGKRLNENGAVRNNFVERRILTWQDENCIQGH